MSLVFAALTPHPPILIPTIGKEALKKINETKKALEKMEEDFYAAHPEIILIISPHGSYFNNAFTINNCPEYETDLREFGDLSTKLKFKGDLAFSHRIRAATKTHNFPAVMISENTLDHGSAVPLYYLTKHLPKIHIIQLGFCNLSWKTHLDFGALLKEQIETSNQRIAVIASGDMSHAITTDAPAGFNASGVKFDQKIQELLVAGNISGMVQMDAQLAAEAAECGFRSLLILMGILQHKNYIYKQLAYEAPFGVGYLTAEFII